jgi:acyl transferase domain-containing protein/acyl carrier protein
VTERNAEPSNDIAIIGMAGRFPRARNIAEFWRNLRDGVEGISHFTDAEMRQRGVAEAALQSENFVRAGAIIEDSDLFDASFFGYSPKEAAIIDPQHRLFLECAWEAIENAGYAPDLYVGLIGVYAGTSLSSYLLYNLLASPAFLNSEDSFQVMIGNDKDFISTRVSYELDLKGPSLDVQTGCSTSLVAVHLACQGLLSYQCDMALAGGVSIQVPQRTGYFYEEGGYNSPDGHCRTFDASAEGTIFGSGLGIVVLKRLADAISDGDTIIAVIKGSAINNDGSGKIGYTAPSIDGQAQVISLAQLLAGVTADHITMLEAHGTATPLGDPVEVAALTKAFRATTEKKGYCAIGSIKSSIGHLDAAAGIAGLIKTALALKHKMIPPTLNFQNPNPKIDFAGSPFYVNASLSEWKTNGAPRCAGVSSFGIGGTNAHVIVAESPAPIQTSTSRPWQLLVFSARTRTALQESTSKLSEFFEHAAEEKIADAAYTLQVGRKVFPYRRALVCKDAEDAQQALLSLDPQRVLTAYREGESPRLAFMFPGGGAQYVNMGQGVYKTEPFFREQLNACFDILEPEIRCDLKEVIYPANQSEEEHAKQLNRVSLALPALFSVEYSMARLWMRWGIRPQAMIGHSLGEYVAACLAGVFSLEDALALVAARGRLIEKLPSGAMLSVALPETEIKSLIDDHLSIAAVNGPSQCVVSGSKEAIEEMASRFTAQEIDFRRIHIGAAGHSEMVAPILDEFTAFIERFDLETPTIPFISNVSGTWIKDSEATDPRYWATHLRHTVRFSDGLKELLREDDQVLLEVGPGQGLSTLAKQQAEAGQRERIFSSIRHPYERQPDEAFLLTTLGKLWLAGTEVDWMRFYEKETRQRIALPSYPFERKRYWIEPSKSINANTAEKSSGKNPDVSQWFYLPSWKKIGVARAAKSADASEQKIWLVLSNDAEIGQRMIEGLKTEGQHVITVLPGDSYSQSGRDAFIINHQSSEDYERLLSELQEDGRLPGEIVHFWSMSDDEAALSSNEAFRESQSSGFYSLLFLAQALAKQRLDHRLHLWVVSDGAQAVESGRSFCPEKATILGACKVIPQEIENISCHFIDVEPAVAGDWRGEKIITHLLAEARSKSPDVVIAYRGNQRWVQSYEQMPLVSSEGALRENGVYLITGGFGGVGFLLARHLAQTVKARLILMNRSRLPERNEWDEWLDSHDGSEPVSQNIHRVRSLEEAGAEVMTISGDVADLQDMKLAIDSAFERFGELNGLIHAAGLAGEKAVSLIAELTRQECENQFRAKAYALYNLEDALRGRNIDFCMLISSNAAVLGGLGSFAYASANTFMDAFAAHRSETSRTRWISANWDGWPTGEEGRINASYQTSMDKYAMKTEESVDAFRRLLSSDASGQVIVSTGDLEQRMNLWVKAIHADIEENAGGERHQQAELDTDYVPPGNEIEQTIIDIWQDLLGIQRLGINDNFFDLGGNSLIGLKVISRLKKQTGIDIPVVALFEGPTVASLAALISNTRDAQPSFAANQSRGERRREKKRRKLHAAENG